MDFDECTCAPCTSPAYGAPGYAHCAACCGGTGIDTYDHFCPIEDHREWAEKQNPLARRVVDLAYALEAIVELAEEAGDLSLCPYYCGTGTCGYGCNTEPECQTCHPREGWTLERRYPAIRNLILERKP